MNISVITSPEHVAAALKERRRFLQMRQRDLKEFTGMSQQQVAASETSGRISVVSLLNLARALSLEVVMIPKEDIKFMKDTLNQQIVPLKDVTFESYSNKILSVPTVGGASEFDNLLGKLADNSGDDE